MKLSIVIPVYNEEKSIQNLLKKISDLKLINGFEKEILVINDCSSDSTEEKIFEFMKSDVGKLIRYFRHDINKGKGGGVKTGIKNTDGDLIIVQDADLEYDPDDINLIIEKFKDDSIKVVYGSRMLKEKQLNRSKFFKGKHPDAYLLAYIGNIIITGLINLLHRKRYTDIFTCYKCFDAAFIKSVQIDNDDFDWEPEITVKFSKANVSIHEVPISYHPRRTKEGKKINAKDGVKAILCILKYTFGNFKM
ncbi:MAG: glycosyltransferase family 2 protein [Ignavibacteria bacterium]|jgi:glycosyltransferase involved in cell wall biosynthesis